MPKRLFAFTTFYVAVFDIMLASSLLLVIRRHLPGFAFIWLFTNQQRNSSDASFKDSMIYITPSPTTYGVLSSV